MLENDASSKYLGRTDIMVEGEIEEVRNYNYSARIFLKACSIEGVKTPNKIILDCDLEDAYFLDRGDYVKVLATLGEMEQPDNPGQVSYKQYYNSCGYRYLATVNYFLSRTACKNPVKIFANKVRHKVEQVYENVLSLEDRGVYQAMLLADKTHLDKDVKQLFSDAGIGHILAISGLHISILGMGLYKFLRRLKCNYFFSALISASLIIFYGIVTGNPVSATRAIIMFVCSVYADVIGRAYDILSAASLAGIMLLFQCPYYIMNCGFLLSFLAIYGVAVVNPAMPVNKNKIFSAISASLSIILATMPVTLWFYYQLPTFSFLLNLLVIPLLGIVMVSALLVALIGQFSFVGAVFMAGPGHYLLLAFRKLSEFFMLLPYSTLTLGRPKVYQIVLYEAFLFAFCIRRSIHLPARLVTDDAKREAFQKAVEYIGVILVAFMLIAITDRHRNSLSVTFLYVGQGDGIFIALPDGKNVFIDGGSSSNEEVYEEVLKPFFKYLGINKIDYLFISHNDADHYNAWMGADIRVKNIYVGSKDYALWQKNLGEGGLFEILDKYSKQDTEIKLSDAGSLKNFGECELICISSSRDLKSILDTEQDREKGYNFEGSDNDDSQVLLLFYQGISFLFTGDISAEQEERITDRLTMVLRERYGMQSVSFLKAAHHGSRFSSSENFLRAIKPDNVIISCGRGNLYGHPHSEMLERVQNEGAAIFRTDVSGAVTVNVKRSAANVIECK